MNNDHYELQLQLPCEYLPSTDTDEVKGLQNFLEQTRQQDNMYLSKNTL